MRKLVGIEIVEPFPIYDIEVDNEHCFELDNGVVAHNSMYPRQIMSGGTGLMYSANDVWIIGRQQDKGSDGEIKGWNFIITIEKSRKVKEKSKIGIHVTYEGGISKFSGMLDLAVEAGLVSKQPAGWYIADGTDKKVREKDLLTNEWLESLLNNESFKEFVKKKYKLVV